MIPQIVATMLFPVSDKPRAVRNCGRRGGREWEEKEGEAPEQPGGGYGKQDSFFFCKSVCMMEICCFCLSCMYHFGE